MGDESDRDGPGGRDDLTSDEFAIFEAEVESDDRPAPIRGSRRVRIIGAEQAGSMVPPEGFSVTEDPLDADPLDDDPFETLSNPEEPDLHWSASRPGEHQTELQHWTDPPTGQVPAILARDEPEISQWQRDGDTGPVWREHDHDWSDPSYEPAMLADEDTRIGELRTEDKPEERRPWEFADSDDAGSTWPSDDDPDDSASGEFASTHIGPVTTISSSVRRVTSQTPPQARSRHGRRRQPVIAFEPSLELGSGALQVGASGAPDERSNGSGRSMPLAIATGVAAAAVILLAMWGGPVPTLVVTTVVVTLCVAEMYGTLRRSGRKSATLLGIAATIGIMIAAYTKGPSAIPYVTVLLLVGTMLWYLIGVERGSPVEGTSSTVFVFVWIGVLGSFAALLLAPSQFPDRHGVAFFAGAIIAGVLNDVGALIAGRWFGRHPLAPTVSPKKTWEGLVGGTILTILGSIFITGHIHPWTTEKAAILGVLVAIVAPVGDLCESLVKRDLKLKDMGSMLPGHGGMLDRFDALLFVMPATYYLVRIVHLG
ncbi:MAG: phosphatidate cytidylyltransferase [Acidimicrobiales bacterium]